MRYSASKSNELDGTKAWAGQFTTLASSISAEQIVTNFSKRTQKLL
jgi:hypothetical protein